MDEEAFADREIEKQMNKLQGGEVEEESDGDFFDQDEDLSDVEME